MFSLRRLNAHTPFEMVKGYEPPQHRRILKDHTIRLTVRVWASTHYELSAICPRKVRHRAMNILPG